MYIYNTTFLVPDRMYGSFIKWIKETHIPRCTASDCFSEATLTRIQSHEQQDGTSVSLQLKAADKVTIEKWQVEHLRKLDAEIADLFLLEVLYFSTLMEII